MLHTNASSSTESLPTVAQRKSRVVAIRLIQWILSTMDTGRLSVELPSGFIVDHRAANAGPEASITIRRWRAIRRLLVSGDIGFAQAYIDNDWSSSDLTTLIELVAKNGDGFLRRIAGLWPVRIANIWQHARRKNSKRGSRHNIQFHYDLGNQFYELWLDESMLYSSALFKAKECSLEQAQWDKMKRILELLQLRGGETVLEIGCGWGELAAAVAARSGSHVSGITLSAAQLEYAQNRVRARGVENQVDLRLQDYRETEGRFDRIVSIEMLEAVGRDYWQTYFETLYSRLKPGGLAIMQVITIAEDRVERYQSCPDFIQRYIFPGGCLPPLRAIKDGIAATGLELVSMETFGESYALTLAEWRRRFLLAWPRIEPLGFGDRFRRLWEYYLCYCEAGFRSGLIDVGLYSLRRARV
jgi:cyclopropane-fatty-acyl-phospholipid synthase